MDEERNRGSSAGPILIVGVLLILIPVLYILSCGPAVALMTRGYMSREVFDVAYFPLRFAVQDSSWIGRLLESYAGLWAA